MKRILNKLSGFTLLEMTIVISILLFLIISIGTVFPALFDQISLYITQTKVVHDIQYYRNYARTTEKPVKFTFIPSSTTLYVVYQADLVSNVWVELVDYNGFFDGTTVSSTTLQENVLVFDHLGQPCETTDATLPLLSTSNPTDSIETISLGSDWVYSTVSVHPVSGLVEVQ